MFDFTVDLAQKWLDLPLIYVLNVIIMNELLVAMTGGKTVADSLLSYEGIQSQKQANRMNYELGQEQLAYDAAKTQFQADFIRKNTQELLKYNKPVNQVARLEEAGINPAFALGQIGGNQSQATASPAGGSPQLPTMNPVDYSQLGRGINESVQLMSTLQNDKANRELVHEQAVTQAIENKWRAMKLQEEINQTKSTTQKNLSEAKTNDVMRDANHQLVMSQSQKNEADIKLVGEQIQTEQIRRELMQAEINLDNQQVNNLVADINLKAAQIAAEFASASASYAAADNFQAQARLNKQMQQKCIQETNNLFEENKGLKLDNQQKKKLQPIVVKQMQNAVRQQGQDYWNPFRYVGTILGGTGSSIVNKLAK